MALDGSSADADLHRIGPGRYSQNAMCGIPISSTFVPFVPSENSNGPPSDLGTVASVNPSTWRNFAFGNACLTAARVEPTPTPLALAPPVTAIVSTLRGLLMVRSTEPLSGASSLAERACGPASSQPRVALPILWARRSDVNDAPTFTPSTPAPEIFAA